MTLLGPVFEAYPDRYETAVRLGEARVRTGDFEGALDPLTRALELRAPDADLLVLLATTHLVLGTRRVRAASSIRRTSWTRRTSGCWRSGAGRGAFQAVLPPLTRALELRAPDADLAVPVPSRTSSM